MKYITDINKKELRQLRSKVCFSVINRGKLWYERLTNEQQGELRAWYQAWLDVTDTSNIPRTPEWINDKLDDEEEI